MAGTVLASLLALGAGLMLCKKEDAAEAAMVTLSDAEGCTDYWTTGERSGQAEK